MPVWHRSVMQPIDDIAAEAELARAIADGAAQAVAEDACGDWVHLFVDFEIDASGERSSSISFALVRAADGGIEKLAFRLLPDVKRRLRRLANAAPGGRWTSAQLRMERDGRYAFDYLYTPPCRLGGVINDTRFAGYVGQWLASKAGAPFRAKPRSWLRRWLGQG